MGLPLVRNHCPDGGVEAARHLPVPVLDVGDRQSLRVQPNAADVTPPVRQVCAVGAESGAPWTRLTHPAVPGAGSAPRPGFQVRIRMSSSSTAVASVGANARIEPPISHHLLPRRLSWIHGPSTTTSWFEHGKAGTARWPRPRLADQAYESLVVNWLEVVHAKRYAREFRRAVCERLGSGHVSPSKGGE